jgi:hypothetical protein
MGLGLSDMAWSRRTYTITWRPIGSGRTAEWNV